MRRDKDKTCFISIDIEHDHGSWHEKNFKGVEKIDEILDVLRREGISATLFVTGEVLEKYSDRAMGWAENHEIGCHSYSHTYFDSMDAPSIKEELDRFVNLYKKVFNSLPYGFRAPSHVITNAAMKAVRGAGFYYDSSVVPHYLPFKKYRGYCGNAPKSPYYPSEASYKHTGGASIMELPVTGQLFGIPIAGAWIRGIPLGVYRLLFFLHRPDYITLSFHSWDALQDDKFLEKLENIIHLFKKYGYQFKRGDEIFNEYVSKNRK